MIPTQTETNLVGLGIKVRHSLIAPTVGGFCVSAAVTRSRTNSHYQIVMATVSPGVAGCNVIEKRVSISDDHLTISAESPEELLLVSAKLVWLDLAKELYRSQNKILRAFTRLEDFI